jgi:hypothetical protein
MLLIDLPLPSIDQPRSFPRGPSGGEPALARSRRWVAGEMRAVAVFVCQHENTDVVVVFVAVKKKVLEDGML